MDLAQVGLRWIYPHARKVLDPIARMRISLDAEAFDDLDFVFGMLGKCMLAGSMYRYDFARAVHHPHSISRYHFVITYFLPLRTFMP